MKSSSFKIATLAATLFISSPAWAQSFSLETRGDDMVCRSESNKPTTCLPSLKKLGRPVHGTIELVDRLQAYGSFLEKGGSASPETVASFGGAIVLKSDEIKEALRQFKRLSVRNVAIDPSGAKIEGNNILYPFYGSVYWISNANIAGTQLIQGTLHFEGYFKVPRELPMIALLSPDVSAARANYEKSVVLSAFTDSSTEQQVAALGWLETAARSVHFRWAGKTARPLDEETSAMLGNLVIPMVVAEAYYVPEMGRLMKVLNKLYPQR